MKFKREPTAPIIKAVDQAKHPLLALVTLCVVRMTPLAGAGGLLFLIAQLK